MDENTRRRKKRLRIFIPLTLVAGSAGILLSLLQAVRKFVTFMETWGVSDDIIVAILALGLFLGIGNLILAKMDLGLEQSWKKGFPVVAVAVAAGILLIAHIMMPTRSRTADLIEILYYVMFSELFFVIFWLVYKLRHTIT